MIVAAGLLVLGGLGLFVAGVFTDVTALYWACVGVCVVAAVLLYLARRRLRAPNADAPAAPGVAPAAAPTAPAAAPAAAGSRTGRHAGTDAATGASAMSPTTATPVPAEQVAPAAAAAAESSATVSGPPAAVPVVPPPAAPPAQPATPAGTTTPTGPTTAAARTEPAGATAVSASATGPVDAGEPPVEEVEVTDLLLVVDLRDEVLVVDEHPRYHVAGCRHLARQETIPIPLDEARTDGFTPCGSCRPDATLADRVRARKGSGGS